MSELSCGSGTYLDPNSNTCACDGAACKATDPVDPKKVFIAGLFHTAGFPWGAEIFNLTVNLINNHTDGWFDDVLDDGSELVTTIADAGCDPRIALPAYWDLKTTWGMPLHGIVGCRCSGASSAVARVAGLEDVNVVSPSSSSSQLSDPDEFSTFSRLVGPDDERGQVGALVSLLRSMGFARVSVISSDTSYTSDLATSFGNAWVGHHDADQSTGTGSWTGEVAYSHTVRLNSDGTVDRESARQALDGVPTDEPRINSRVIVLLAHHQHAYPILRMSQEVNFQPDTIWVGTSAWSGRLPTDGDTSWMPPVPGYLGVVHSSLRNRDSVYQDFLGRLQEAQFNQGRPVMNELPDYAAGTMVDSILSLTMALSAVDPELRSDGQAVLSALRNITFSGVSGPVQFTAEGDRANPRYTVVNWQDGGTADWTVVGEVGPTLDSANIRVSDICWAVSGCGLSAAPLDRYHVAPPKLPIWVWVVIPVVIVVALALGLKYWLTRRKKIALKYDINAMQATIDAMKNIDSELEDLDKKVEEAKRRKASLIQERVGLQERPPTWSDSPETLVEILPDDKQYWDVSDKLRETMGDAWISRAWRIQNYPLWNYFNFHKNRLTINGINHNERQVWHGTSSLDPAIIYNDQQDGFMMQFSQRGFWGRGIYFAQKSRYSHSYTFRAHGSCPTERSEFADGEREMFLASLLVGNEVKMDRDESSAKAEECRNLSVPPTDPASNLKYNTVTGFTAGSQVWIVYENGRAYPDYLVRYYRGKRDASRTPYASRDEATKAKEEQNVEQPAGNGLFSFLRQSDRAANQAEMGFLSEPIPSWEYLDATGTWKGYDAAAQTKIELTYQQFAVARSSTIPTVQIKSGDWTYEINVDAMEQTNIEHHDHTKRKIQRRTT